MRRQTLELISHFPQGVLYDAAPDGVIELLKYLALEDLSFLFKGKHNVEGNRSVSVMLPELDGIHPQAVMKHGTVKVILLFLRCDLIPVAGIQI